MRLLLLLVLLPAMLVLCFLTPPFQVADEPAHYLRADGVSHGSLTPERLTGEDGRPAAGGEVDRGAVAFVLDAGPRTIAHWTPGSRADVERLLHRPYPSGSATAAYSNTAIYPPLLYLPDAAAIGAFRVLGATPVLGFYAGRIANVLAATLCLFLAIGRAGRFAPFVVCCASVPIVVFSAASLSADALLTPLAIAFAALLGTLPDGDPKSRPLALALVALLFTVAKIAYVPLAVAPAVAAWWLDGRWSRRARLLAGAGVIAVVCWAAWAWVVHADVFSIRTDIMIDPARQAKWIAAHPRWFAHIAFGQIRVQARDLVLGAFGYRLGWANLPIPGWISLTSAAAIVAAACLVAPEEAAPRPRLLPAAFVALAAACASAIAILLYLQFNAVGAKAIDGIQGRYFLPLFIFAAPWLPRLRTASAPVLRETAAALSAVLSAAYLVAAAPGWWRP